MPRVKIATFNIEWLAAVFGGKWASWDPPIIPASFPGATLGDIALEPIADVHALCRRVAGVISGLDAQIIGLQEAPPLRAQMELFVAQFLGGEYVVHHSNARWQSISALVHRSIADRVTAWQPDLPGPGAAWSNIPYYPWGGIAAADREEHALYRHPLLLSFTPEAGKELRVMVLHTKSKFSRLKTLAQWEARERGAILDALTTRAKLAAEIRRVREFLDRQLSADGAPRSFIVMGDLNDGPFAELLEREFLIRNIIDDLVGSLLHPDLHLRHAMTPETLRTATTTRFADPLQGGAIVEELIDHILVSPAIWQKRGDFRVRANSCRVEAAVYDAHNDDTGPQRRRELRPSDHKPVSVVLNY